MKNRKHMDEESGFVENKYQKENNKKIDILADQV
jgi:hypothetical protein